MNINVEKVKNTCFNCSEITDKKEHIVVKNNIKNAMNKQFNRYQKNGVYNGSISSVEIFKFIKLSTDASIFLTKASKKLKLSARSYFKTIKVAQTIADLEDSELVTTTHISEALSFRKR